ncbi:hypothetical protein PHJA_002236600 [Phtheirospermum japonicum]|uniref:DUF4378 domain-containing protein n=1 Tax=Phtheirospermum japonicum TaxID=374723 RepID=A0A830CNN1_9LAMI|nr:hypothetical protein PHJA_002236600 [Phtheirospermum japonicum]
MERARRRNSKSASGVGGVHQIQKHKAASRLYSDSRSYFDGSTGNDMFMLDLGQSSDGRATGRLIKKLLRDKMLKQTESRRRSPSGISGLMVLEGHVRKQQKTISDSYEFDDASDEENRHCLSRWRARSMLAKANLLHNHSCPDGTHTSFSRRAHNSHKSSKALSEVKNKLPVRIVVLKPNNHGNKHNSGSSRYLSHRRKENTSVSAYDVRFFKSSSEEARLIAREITRRMRGDFDETLDTKYSSFGRYAGGESSYDASESDFDSDPDMFNLFSKKRPAESWKITHRYDRKASLRYGRSNFAKKCQSRKEILSSHDSKSRSKKPFPCQHICNDEKIYSSLEAYSEIQMEENVKDLSEKQFTLSEPRSETSSSDPSMSHRNQSSAIDNDEAAARDQEDFSLQELYKRPPGSSPLQYVAAEPASSESSKETDHASPVSVLESPFIEDASSCSESSEKDGTEQNEGNYTLGAEGWESSYALDVLIHSGLLQLSLDTFTTKWYSPDCPLDPVLFDDLEMKYDNKTRGLRSERRLEFDRQNSALLEIFQKHVDLRPWVRPKLADSYYPTWRRERVGDALEKLIKQKYADVQEQEKMLDVEMQWLGYEGEIDAIGNVIVKLLIHDMIWELSWITPDNSIYPVKSTVWFPRLKPVMRNLGPAISHERRIDRTLIPLRGRDLLGSEMPQDFRFHISPATGLLLAFRPFFAFPGRVQSFRSSPIDDRSAFQGRNLNLFSSSTVVPMDCADLDIVMVVIVEEVTELIKLFG